MTGRKEFALPDAFLIRYDGIDEEHLRLVNLVNELNADLADGEAREFEGPFSRLVALLEQHFQHEESHMQALGYKGLAWHRDHHQDCLERTRQLLQACRDQGYADKSTICDCFCEIVEDVASADLKFGEFLDGMGLRDQ